MSPEKSNFALCNHFSATAGHLTLAKYEPKYELQKLA